MSKYCIGCSNQLEENPLLECPNPACIRFGLLTSRHCTQQFAPEDVAKWRQEQALNWQIKQVAKGATKRKKAGASEDV